MPITQLQYREMQARCERARNPHMQTTQNPPVECSQSKRIRQSTKPLLNKLETRFFEGVLRHRFSQSIITSQAMRFMLANGIWYKPDFVVFIGGMDSQDRRLRAFEVKGPHAFRGGFENLKVAANRYPFIRWTLAWERGGQWREQEVLP